MGDDFLREKSYFHANVRQCCVSTVDEEGVATGVEVVTALEQSIDIVVVVGIVFQLIDCPSLGDPAKETMGDWCLLVQEV